MSNIKEIITSDLWIIKKVKGDSKKVRVDAVRRFPVADKSSLFSQWVSTKYLNKLTMEKYNKKYHQLHTFQYD